VRNIADACRYIVAGAVASYQQFGFGLYLVALQETAVPIGICGLLKRESMKDIEIGFAFLERFWAKGYAYESAAVMDYPRTSLGLKRIAATTALANRGSIQVLENTSTRILVCAREHGLFRADVSRCLNCKKYNLGRENHTKLGY
jgi:RimJ/RimL family protein N-acetyltransferase